MRLTSGRLYDFVLDLIRFCDAYQCSHRFPCLSCAGRLQRLFDMEEAVGKGGRSLISARKEKGGPTSDAAGLPLPRAREGAAETNNCLDVDA